ncbi:SpoIIE family protein phosphatase [Planctomycetota bacterium]
MRIRNRLLILLLAIALIPLLASALLYQASIRHMSQRLTERTKDSLDRRARETLLALLASNTETFRRDGLLVQAALKRQILEVETRLSLAPVTTSKPWLPQAYGVDFNLPEPDKIPSGDSPTLDFQRQGFLLAQGTSYAEVQEDLTRLQSMTSVYHDLYRHGASGMLWLYTSLENGLLTSYPGAQQRLDPNTYDPRDRPWYTDAVKENDMVRRVLIDASTGKMIVTIAAPVRDSQDALLGVTAMDRTIHDILQNFALPNRWNIGADKFIVDVNEAPSPHLDIILKENDKRARHSWGKNLPAKRLVSEDPNELQALIVDLNTGHAGARSMRYQGEDCLWVYRNLQLDRLAVVLIIPYPQIHAQAYEEEQFIQQEGLFWLELSGIGLIGAIAIAIFLAFTRSHQVTRPIRELTAAGLQLAAGNYRVQVDIQTGDELQRLGEVFNQTGPALQERATLKESLELARTIQQNLLPKKAPTLKGFDIAARCLYCDETGGDYYDFIDLRQNSSGKVGLALGDVTGHGIGAALLMAAVRSVLHAESRHCRDDLVGLFHTMNNQIARDTEEDKFVTFFYGLLDETNHSLTWASAGHDPALHYQSHNGQIVELPNTGMLMGLFEDTHFDKAGPVFLQSGDILVVGTDGIWEAQNPHGEYFGKERLCALIRNADSRSADTLCADVVQQVTDFIAPGRRMDDITLIVVKAS